MPSRSESAQSGGSVAPAGAGGAKASDSAGASSQLATEQAVRTSLQGQLSGETGVDMDAQMSNLIALQNAYGANAKVIGAVQSLYSALLAMVNP